MILSHRHRFIFIHIPKTGGTAVTRVLEGQLGPDDVLISDTKAARARGDGKAHPGLWKHSKLGELGALMDGTEDYAVVTIVRNPYDRMVSFYTWAQAQKFEHPMIAAAQKLTFSQFLRDGHVVGAMQMGPAQAYVAGAEAEFLRFETLAADFAALAARLGFEAAPLPQANVSDRTRDYRQYYRDEDIAQVARICARDIADFAYSF